MIDYLGGIIRENPRDDLISALVAAKEQGDAFSEEEL
jgi:cytochrome P450